MIWTKWSTRTHIVIASAAILIFAAALATFFVIQKDKGDAGAVNQALTLAEEKTIAGDYAQALDALEQAKSQAKDAGQKIQLLNSLAAAAANAGKLSEALNYYEQKHQLDPASTAADGYLVGELYERLGETQKAIEQFERYLEHVKANPPEETGQAMIESIEIRIQQMKEGLQ